MSPLLSATRGPRLSAPGQQHPSAAQSSRRMKGAQRKSHPPRHQAWSAASLSSSCCADVSSLLLSPGSSRCPGLPRLRAFCSRPHSHPCPPAPARSALSALRIALPPPSPDSKTVLVAQISLFFKSLAIFSWFSPLIFAQCSVICQQQRCRTGPWGASRAPARSSPCLGASPRHPHLPA